MVNSDLLSDNANIVSVDPPVKPKLHHCSYSCQNFDFTVQLRVFSFLRNRQEVSPAIMGLAIQFDVEGVCKHKSRTLTDGQARFLRKACGHLA